MDFAWIANALGDVAWIALAFVLGLLSRAVGLPPLIGFLAAGFLLNALGFTGGEMLNKLADLGITLLLFTVGLKLNLRTLARPQVWAVTSLHMVVVVALLGTILFSLALIGMPYLADLSFRQALLIAFAFSFSSTVFVVKELEEKGQMASLQGRVAVGILIMQDLIAVVFLAASTGELPSPWAIALLALWPFRWVIHRLLERVGHDELLVLYGFLLALGGAELFGLVGIKGDLGALVVGVMIATHAKADEMAKTMLGFKDLFLLGFFLSIGLSGEAGWQMVLMAALIAPFILLKSCLFFWLLIRFYLRSRTALFTSLNLTNYSEFGLIVAAVGVANGWIETHWLTIIAVAVALSFMTAAILNRSALWMYDRYRSIWKALQRPERLPDDRLLDIGSAKVVVIGMGGIGSGAYQKMRDEYGDQVIGVDIDPVTVKNHKAAGRQVLLGDPSDADFWDRVQTTHQLQLVMLALPKISTHLEILQQLKAAGYDGRVSATAKFPDEESALREAGVDTVFNTYAEAGAGFAGHVLAQQNLIGS